MKTLLSLGALLLVISLSTGTAMACGDHPVSTGTVIDGVEYCVGNGTYQDYASGCTGNGSCFQGAGDWNCLSGLSPNANDPFVANGACDYPECSGYWTNIYWYGVLFSTGYNGVLANIVVGCYGDPGFVAKLNIPAIPFRNHTSPIEAKARHVNILLYKRARA